MLRLSKDRICLDLRINVAMRSSCKYKDHMLKNTILTPSVDTFFGVVGDIVVTMVTMDHCILQY